MKTGDFFGLDVFESFEKNSVYLIVDHDFQGELLLEVSYNGITWVCSKIYLIILNVIS